MADKKIAVRKLVRNAGDQLIVMYYDATTGQQINDLTGYTVMSANTGDQVFDGTKFGGSTPATPNTPQTPQTSENNPAFDQRANERTGESWWNTPEGQNFMNQNKPEGTVAGGLGGLIGGLIGGTAGNLISGISGGADYTSTLPGGANSELTNPKTTPAKSNVRNDGIIGSTPALNAPPNSSATFLTARNSGLKGFTGVNADGLNPEFADRMTALISAAEQATGSKATITEGFRNAKTQAQYYANYTGKPVSYGGTVYKPEKKGGLAAKPGNSEHQAGMAMDVDTNSPAYHWMTQHASDFGVHWFGAADKPHFELPPDEYHASLRGKPPASIGADLIKKYAPDVQPLTGQQALPQTQHPPTNPHGQAGANAQPLPNVSGSPDDRNKQPTKNVSGSPDDRDSKAVSALQNLKGAVGDSTPVNQPSWWNQAVGDANPAKDAVTLNIRPKDSTGFPVQATDRAGTVQMAADRPNVPVILGDNQPTLNLLGNPDFEQKVAQDSTAPWLNQTPTALAPNGVPQVGDALKDVRTQSLNQFSIGDPDEVFKDAYLKQVNGAEGAPTANTLFGGKTITLGQDHPNVKVAYDDGRATSTAAGYGQFTYGTWNAVNSKYFANTLNFANENDQKTAMWKLAEVNYKTKTGRDLLSDLKSGDQSKIASAFANNSNQWASLPGGKQPNSNLTDLVAGYTDAVDNHAPAQPVEQPPASPFISMANTPYEGDGATADKYSGIANFASSPELMAASTGSVFSDVASGVVGKDTSSNFGKIGSQSSKSTGGIAASASAAGGVSKSTPSTGIAAAGASAAGGVTQPSKSAAGSQGGAVAAGANVGGGVTSTTSHPSNVQSTPIGSKTSTSTGGIANTPQKVAGGVTSSSGTTKLQDIHDKLNK